MQKFGYICFLLLNDVVATGPILKKLVTEIGIDLGWHLCYFLSRYNASKTVGGASQ